MNRLRDSTEYRTLLPILTTPISCEAVKAHNFRGLIDNTLAASFGFRSILGGAGLGISLLTVVPSPSPSGIDGVQLMPDHSYRVASIESQCARSRGGLNVLAGGQHVHDTVERLA